jgi:hypothetical protein
LSAADTGLREENKDRYKAVEAVKIFLKMLIVIL